LEGDPAGLPENLKILMEGGAPAPEGEESPGKFARSIALPALPTLGVPPDSSGGVIFPGVGGKLCGRFSLEMRFSLTAEQLEAARAERMRQNGHGATTLEDVRTWIEETGLCIFLPRSAQAGFTAPTFVEAVAGQRTTEPTLELIETAEQLLVRLEADGVAVRLNLAGQSHNQLGDQPDYVVAGWVLPYVYALRGDRDWRRSPQLTGSRQVSPLAVQVAKHIDTANLTSAQIRDAVGREVTEAAVLRALHELWKQLRIIPVVPEIGQPALWQPLRQRFQKAIAEGASTSQVTAISVLASIYLQAVIAASMEEIEMFLSPLTSRSKIREVVRGLAATRQVHSTTMGHSSMYYVAGTLPEFPVELPAYQVATSYPSSYFGSFKGGYQRSFTASAVETVVDTAIDEELDDAPLVDEFEEIGAFEGMSDESSQRGLRSPATDSSLIRPGSRFQARPAAARPRPIRTGSSGYSGSGGNGHSGGSGSGSSPRFGNPSTIGASSGAGNGARAESRSGGQNTRPAAPRPRSTAENSAPRKPASQSRPRPSAVRSSDRSSRPNPRG